MKSLTVSGAVFFGFESNQDPHPHEDSLGLLARYPPLYEYRVDFEADSPSLNGFRKSAVLEKKSLVPSLNFSNVPGSFFETFLVGVSPQLNGLYQSA